MHQSASDGGLSSAADQQRIKGLFVCTNRYRRSTDCFERLMNPGFQSEQGVGLSQDLAKESIQKCCKVTTLNNYLGAIINCWVNKSFCLTYIFLV